MPEPLIDIRPDHLKIVLDILERRVPDREVWAFGSRATWRTKDYSDLDLAVIGDTPLPLAVSAALSDDFAESDLPFKVDVVDWATTSETFKGIIERDKVIIRGGCALPWREFTVEQIKANADNALATGPFGSAISSRHFKDHGTPVIRGSNLSSSIGERLIEDNFVFVDDAKATEFKRSVARQGDLIFTCWGTVDQVGMIDRHAKYDKYIISNKQMKLTPNPAIADSSFLYYLFSSPEFRERILSQAIGSSVPGFNLGQLRMMKLRIPRVAEQREIAAVLEALDEKINSNRRMNVTLEAIARALFRSWFLDFDNSIEQPQICKFASRLFDMVDLLGGGTPTTSRNDYWGGDIPWFSVVDAPAASDVFVLGTEKTITQSGLENSSTRLLPPNTTIVTARGTVGKLALTGRTMAMNQSCYGVRGKDGRAPYFTYFLMRSSIDGLQACTHGSVFDTITRATFEAIEVNDPGAEATQAFDRAVAPMMLKIKANLEQTHTLAQLRDTLLPKLLSGELRIPDAEKAVEAVA